MNLEVRRPPSANKNIKKLLYKFYGLFYIQQMKNIGIAVFFILNLKILPYFLNICKICIYCIANIGWEGGGLR
jgi:hypothetical protein